MSFICERCTRQKFTCFFPTKRSCSVCEYKGLPSNIRKHYEKDHELQLQKGVSYVSVVKTHSIINVVYAFSCNIMPVLINFILRLILLFQIVWNKKLELFYLFITELWFHYLVILKIPFLKQSEWLKWIK